MVLYTQVDGTSYRNDAIKIVGVCRLLPETHREGIDRLIVRLDWSGYSLVTGRTRLFTSTTLLLHYDYLVTFLF